MILPRCPGNGDNCKEDLGKSWCEGNGHRNQGFGQGLFITNNFRAGLKKRSAPIWESCC